MTPAIPNVPDEILIAGAEAVERELASGVDYAMAIDSDEALAAAVIAAVRPLIEAQERARIGDAIEAGPEPFHPVICPPRIAWAAATERAARIARGETP